MNKNTQLSTRMKTYYEQIPKTKLMRRTPVAIRIDGKAFHTFTRGFKRPFDEVLIKSMQETAKYLCEHIMGCVLAYTQSDEITLILVDYKHLDSEAWFDYEVQKLCSISASMATMAFNKIFFNNVQTWSFNHVAFSDRNPFRMDTEENQKLLEVYNEAIEQGAMFDARCFNIPKEEVTNLIYWRQDDATRNSIQMVGQANFSHKELQNKSRSNIQDMLMEQKGINWNDYPIHQKRGSCVIKNKTICEPYGNRMLTNEVPEGHWFIDTNIPIFKGADRAYIDDLIVAEE